MGINIVTGLQANSQLHIGNYFGGIEPIVRRQNALKEGDELYMMAVDLHSYTMPIDHQGYYQRVLNNFRWYLASGVNPNQKGVSIFRQSRVPAHTELAWHLSCFSYFGELSRMTQFKDKTARLETEGGTVSVGLFTYPILMAADILLYDALYVPVGEDQRQHIEITRDVAIRFNKRFDEAFADGVFVIPRDWKAQLEFTNQEEGVRIRSLSNPEKKMSKSVADPKGTILLSDDSADAAKKVMSATTDSVGEINWDWDHQPGITNLLQLAYLLENKGKKEVIAQWQGQSQYGNLKKHVAELMEAFLENIQSEAKELTDDKIELLLANGEKRANQKSQRTLARVRFALGLEKE